MKKIVVIGSSNTDMVIQSAHLPIPGETILGGTFFMNAGGKGANQAVSAARLQGDVIFICKTGNDVFGEQSIQRFEAEGIDSSYMISDLENPSGVALITIDEKGENTIVVASGSNATLLPRDLQGAHCCIEEAGILLMQLEIPLATVEYAVKVAAAKGVTIILNPAPATTLNDSLLRHISILTPNETEAEKLTGINIKNGDSARKAAQAIHDKGVETIIITLGSKGALLYHEGIFTDIPAVPVHAVDTTAAGDVFNGALAVALSENKSMQEAVAFAAAAAAISVTRPGAQSAAPYRHEL